MFSILDLQHRSEPEETLETGGELEEYELIVGRRQIASVLFVFTIVLMICIAISYLAGKSMASKAAVAAPIAAVVRQPEPPVAAAKLAEPAPEPPLLAEPKNGAVYIQMAAVEKGLAMVFADGLRKRGLPSIVAQGPSEKLFRVLIGPLPDPASYVRAKDAVDKLGLSTFARKFPQ